jgi:hypothetical protein
MEGNRQAGDLYDRYEAVGRPAFQLSEDTRKFLLMLFVFSLVFFALMYGQVYGGGSSTK